MQHSRAVPTGELRGAREAPPPAWPVATTSRTMSNKLFRAIPSHAGAERSLLRRASPPERAQCMQRAVRSQQAHRESSRRRCRWRRAMPTSLVRCQTSSFARPEACAESQQVAHATLRRLPLRIGLLSCLRMLRSRRDTSETVPGGAPHRQTTTTGGWNHPSTGYDLQVHALASPLGRQW